MGIGRQTAEPEISGHLGYLGIALPDESDTRMRTHQSSRNARQYLGALGKQREESCTPRV